MFLCAHSRVCIGLDAQSVVRAFKHWNTNQRWCAPATPNNMSRWFGKYATKCTNMYKQKCIFCGIVYIIENIYTHTNIAHIRPNRARRKHTQFNKHNILFEQGTHLSRRGLNVSYNVYMYVFMCLQLYSDHNVCDFCYSAHLCIVSYTYDMLHVRRGVVYTHTYVGGDVHLTTRACCTLSPRFIYISTYIFPRCICWCARVLVVCKHRRRRRPADPPQRQSVSRHSGRCHICVSLHSRIRFLAFGFWK